MYWAFSGAMGGWRTLIFFGVRTIYKLPKLLQFFDQGNTRSSWYSKRFSGTNALRQSSQLLPENVFLLEILGTLASHVYRLIEELEKRRGAFASLVGVFFQDFQFRIGCT